MKFIRAGDEENDWTLDFEQQIELADGCVLIPFTPNTVIQTNDEIVDYSFSNFAAIQSYSHVGHQLLALANKFDLLTTWKQYDKIFVPQRNYKTGIRIVDTFNVWVVGVNKGDDICSLVFHIIE